MILRIVSSFRTVTKSFNRLNLRKACILLEDSLASNPPILFFLVLKEIKVKYVFVSLIFSRAM